MGDLSYLNTLQGISIIEWVKVQIIKEFYSYFIDIHIDREGVLKLKFCFNTNKKV